MNKDQVKGAAKDIVGKVQEEAGKVLGSKEQQIKGLSKQISGKAQKGVGDVKQAVEDLKKELADHCRTWVRLLAAALLCLRRVHRGRRRCRRDCGRILARQVRRLAESARPQSVPPAVVPGHRAETADGVTGDIYARIDYPFATVRAALKNPGDWCDILILHINTKYCRAASGSQGVVLDVSIGKKYDQAAARTPTGWTLPIALPRKRRTICRWG